MPTYQKIVESIDDPRICYENRQKLIKEIESITERPLLVYVADIKNPRSTLDISDKTGFSDLIQDVKSKDVDILINSPGGFVEAAEIIVDMLRYKFSDIRFAIPNFAKSAATLLVLSGNSLLMDHRSELGPIDPQVQYRLRGSSRQEAAEDIIEGFKKAKVAINEEGSGTAAAYIPLLEGYSLGLLQNCENAKKLSQNLAEKWLKNYMFANGTNDEKIEQIVSYFGSRSETLSHSRPILIDKCIELGVKVADMRKSNKKSLAGNLWRLWCLYEIHFERSSAYKVYENSKGCTLQKLSAIRAGMDSQKDSDGKKATFRKPKRIELQICINSNLSFSRFFG